MLRTPRLPALAPARPLRHAPLWRLFGIWLIIAGLSLLFICAWGFEGAVALLARALSVDGHIEAGRRAMLITLFIEAGLVCLILGSLAFGASHAASRQRLKGWLYDDPLTRSDNRVPNGARVASITTALGLAIIAFWWVRMSAPLKFEALFVKEGPLELLTFLALVVSAALCLLAARHTVRLNKAAVARVIAGCYAVLGAGLFVIGMEEISWGQTYLRWQTPESWAAINSQRETTVHNLLEQRTLHVIEQRIILAFVAFALIAIWLAIRQVHPFITALAPHFSTAPILLLVGYSAYRFHLEVPEILFAIFVSAYAWRVYRARCRTRQRPSILRLQALVQKGIAEPISAADGYLSLHAIGVHSSRDRIMNSFKALLVTASLGALSLPGIASAACSHSTQITNDSGATLRFVELKSSYAAPFFKSQWTGLRTIAPGATGTINWTSDLDCEDDSGVPNHFDVKLIRSIGKEHYCDNLERSEAVRVNTPDLCFH